MINDLSICIVIYNDYDEVIDAVTSIETYTSSVISKKIYLVDNSPQGNEHHKQQLINKLSSYTDVEYLNTDKNLGFGKGQNLVIDRIDSKYHAIVNPDIELKEDAFSSIIDYMENNLDVGMVIPNIVDKEGKRQLAYRREVTLFDMFIRMFVPSMFPKRIADHTLQAEDYSKPFNVPFGQGSFLVIRTELFKQLNGFDDRYFMYLEDADLCKRVNKISKLMYIPDATVIHKWEKGSHKSLRLLFFHIRSMNRYFIKWGIKII